MRTQSGTRIAAHRILIVEANDAIRAVLAALFEDDGFFVATASSRAEALAIVSESPRAIGGLVLDVGLGEPGDGEALLRELAALERPPATLLLSALRSRVEPLALRYGVPFLVKPFDLPVLHSRLLTTIEEGARPRASVA